MYLPQKKSMSRFAVVVCASSSSSIRSILFDPSIRRSWHPLTNLDFSASKTDGSTMLHWSCAIRWVPFTLSAASITSKVAWFLLLSLSLEGSVVVSRAVDSSAEVCHCELRSISTYRGRTGGIDIGIYIEACVEISYIDLAALTVRSNCAA